MKLSKSTAVIVVLILALVGTNLFWFYSAVDAGITGAYRDQALEEHHQALAELLTVSPIAADPTATPEAVLKAARDTAEGQSTFEKDGFTWVGHLGYRFDAAGRLVEIRTTWPSL